MAYAIQSLPEEERLSCEYKYCHNFSEQYVSMLGDESSYQVKKDKVCKPSEERYEQIENYVWEEEKKHGVHGIVISDKNVKKKKEIGEPLRKFINLCRYEIADMPKDEKYGYLPYIFLD